MIDPQIIVKYIYEEGKEDPIGAKVKRESENYDYVIFTSDDIQALKEAGRLPAQEYPVK